MNVYSENGRKREIEKEKLTAQYTGRRPQQQQQRQHVFYNCKLLLLRVMDDMSTRCCRCENECLWKMKYILLVHKHTHTHDSNKENIFMCPILFWTFAFEIIIFTMSVFLLCIHIGGANSKYGKSNIQSLNFKWNLLWRNKFLEYISNIFINHFRWGPNVVGIQNSILSKE